jgi:hydroxypyruvate reductase
LRAAFDAAVRAAHPAQCLPPFVPEPARGRTIVVGFGKAAVSMARTLCDHHAGPLAGLVVTRYGHGLRDGETLPGIEVLEAGHPVPDAASVAAAERILGLLRGLSPDDQVIALVSGGGSALLALPAAGITLVDKQALARQLLASGATIAEINGVRKKLSAVKGGRLAQAAAPARVIVLAISDVPGDHIGDIASGPFSPDATTCAEALAVLDRYGCRASESLRRFLLDPAHETPKPGDPAFARVQARLCARSADALAAAAAVMSQAGFQPVLMDDRVNVPARALAAEHARRAREYAAAGAQVALITGGETTVAVRNPAGRGGRNTEYLLTLALALDGSPGIWALAADTDGIDGTEDNAGALLTPDSLGRAAGHGIDPTGLLADNRGWDFFAPLGDLLVTGPTGTNVNDLRIVIVGAH